MSSASDEVSVWTMAAPSFGSRNLDLWRSVLSVEETARAQQLFSAADRANYVAARALLRNLLQAVGGLPARAWEISITDSGKPAVAGPHGAPLPQISVTHTDGLVACAAGIDVAVGIDAESTRGKIPVEVAEATLAPDELRDFTAAPADRREEIFLRLWTLREAYIKAAGLDLHFPHENFCFGLDPPRITFLDGPDSGRSSEWRLFNWSTGRHILSLAVRPTGRQSIAVNRRQIGQDELTAMLGCDSDLAIDGTL